jgi:hypothetical protein
LHFPISQSFLYIRDHLYIMPVKGLGEWGQKLAKFGDVH